MATDKDLKLMYTLFPDDNTLNILMDKLGFLSTDKLGFLSMDPTQAIDLAADWVRSRYENLKPYYANENGKISKSEIPSLASAIVRDAAKSGSLSKDSVSPEDIAAKSMTTEHRGNGDAVNSNNGFVFEKEPIIYDTSDPEKLESTLNKVAAEFKEMKQMGIKMADIKASKELSTRLVKMAQAYSDIKNKNGEEKKINVNDMIGTLAGLITGSSIGELSANTLNTIKKNAGLVKGETLGHTFAKSDEAKAASRRSPDDATLFYKQLINNNEIGGDRPRTGAIWRRYGYKPQTIYAEQIYKNGMPSVYLWDTINPQAQTEDWKKLSGKTRKELFESNPDKYTKKNGREPMAILQGLDMNKKPRTVSMEDRRKDPRFNEKEFKPLYDMMYLGEDIPGYTYDKDGNIIAPDGTVYDEDFNTTYPGFDAESFKKNLASLELTPGQHPMIQSLNTLGKSREEQIDYATHRKQMGKYKGRDVGDIAVLEKYSEPRLRRMLDKYGYVIGPDNKVYSGYEALAAMAPGILTEKLAGTEDFENSPEYTEMKNNPYEWAKKNAQAVPTLEDIDAESSSMSKEASALQQLKANIKSEKRIQKIYEALGIPYDDTQKHAFVTRTNMRANSNGGDATETSIAAIDDNGNIIGTPIGYMRNGKLLPDVKELIDAAKADTLAQNREDKLASMTPIAAAKQKLRWDWAEKYKNNAWNSADAATEVEELLDNLGIDQGSVEGDRLYNSLMKSIEKFSEKDIARSDKAAAKKAKRQIKENDIDSGLGPNETPKIKGQGDAGNKYTKKVARREHAGKVPSIAKIQERGDESELDKRIAPLNSERETKEQAKLIKQLGKENLPGASQEAKESVQKEIDDSHKKATEQKAKREAKNKRDKETFDTLKDVIGRSGLSATDLF